MENIKSGHERNYDEEEDKEEQEQKESRTMSPMSTNDVKISQEEENEIEETLREEEDKEIKEEQVEGSDMLIDTNESKSTQNEDVQMEDAHQTKANSTTGTTENNNGVIKSATESEEEGEVKSIHSQQSPNIKEEVETQNETKESSSPYEDALEDGEIAE